MIPNRPIPWQVLFTHPVSRALVYFTFGTLWTVAGLVILIAHHGVSKLALLCVILGSAFVFLGGSEKLFAGSYFRWTTRVLALVMIALSIYLSFV